MTPFLFGGTVLGWYRECAIIPYTADMDMAVPATQYRKELEKALIADKNLMLRWVLGKPNYSLELSVTYMGVKIDLFFLYEEADKTWVGGMFVPEKEKLRWEYPKLMNLCTAELKERLFYVPCNVVDFLEADYGPEWREPFHDDQFVWFSSHRNVKRVGKWSTNEWTAVYRTNFRRGR